jgi:hypothetical protein
LYDHLGSQKNFKKKKFINIFRNWPMYSGVSQSKVLRVSVEIRDRQRVLTKNN